MSTTNVNPENDIEPPANQHGTDISSATAEEIAATITEQFAEGATAVVLHGTRGRTARILTPEDVDADADHVVLHGDDETVRVPARELHTAAASTHPHAGVPLGTEVEVRYESQNKQYGTQTRTGTVVDWTPRRLGCVHSLTIETDDGDHYHVWASRTGCIEKTIRCGSNRKVGTDATVEEVED
jgi:hypothetical protein